MGFEKKKVLIADDNQSYLMYLAIILRRMGFDVLLAEDGVETLKLIKRIRPDLVMLDCMMPNLDGISVLRYLRTENDSEPFNVVMMSSDTNALHPSEKLDSCGFLQKPVKIEELHDILQDCIFRPVGFKRKHMRIPFSEKVLVTLNGTTHELFAEMLSGGGIYVRKKDPFPIASELSVSIPMKDGQAITCTGRVIYVKGIYADLFRVPPGMAIEFRDIRPDDADKLKSCINEYLAGDIWEEQEKTYIEKSGIE